jgi:RsiW-degrading membrane proteinase PrsW (M82 family)
VVRSSSPHPAEELAYAIELWRESGDSVERILARAASAALAHAIFKAVQVEHPGRRITLSAGERIIADSVA